MPTFNTPLLQQAYDMYALTIKKEKQRKRFEEVFRDASSLQDLIKYTEKTKESDKKKRSTRVLNKLDKLLGFIRQNSGVLETLSQINGLVGCSIWGPMKLVVKLLSDSRAAIEKISRMMERLVQNAEFCKKYQELHGGDDLVQSSLKSFYYDVVHFCAVAVRNFEQSNWKKVLKPLYRSASADFDMVIEDLEFHGKKVSEAATVADMEQAKSFRNRVDDRYDKDKKEQIDKDRRKKEARTRCWLNPGSYYIDQHKQQQGSKIKGTNDWFIKHTHFEEWEKQDKRRLLWVHGKPGCGKSFLASTAIQHLRDKNTNPLYYFYNEKEAREDFHRASIGFLGAFLLQLFETNSDEVKDTMIAAWEKAVDKDRVASFYTLRQVLLDCLPKINGKIVCILDALDECTDHELLVKCIANVSKDFDKIKFCIISRDEALIRKNFGPLCEKDGIGLEFPIEDDDIGGDIKTYVETKIMAWAPDKRQMSGIESRLDELVSQAEGMFLWARLMMDILDDTDSPKEIKNVLSNTPKALDGMYELIFSRIVNNCRGNESKLRCSQNIFKWATCATRSLTIDELRVALAINKGDKDFQEENLIFESAFRDRIRVATGQLIDITPSGTIQVTHLTVKEFLFKKCPENAVYKDWIFKSDHVHADLAEVTLTMMSFERFTVEYLSRVFSEEFEKHGPPYVFLKYAAKSWAVHCSKIREGCKEQARELYEKIKTFIQTEQSYLWYFIMYDEAGHEGMTDAEETLEDWADEIVESDSTIFQNVFEKILLLQYSTLTTRGLVSAYAVGVCVLVANLRAGEGRYEEAERLLLKTLDMCGKLKPDPEDDMTSPVLHELSKIMRLMDRHEESEQVQLKIIELEKSAGDEKSEVRSIGMMASLALTYRKQNRNEEADHLHQKSIKLIREKIKKGSKGKDCNIAGTCEFIADCCLARNEYRLGTELYEISIDLYMQTLGIENFETQWAMRRLSNCYSDLGPEYFDKREKLDKHILALMRDKYGPNHRKSVEYVETLGDTYCAIATYYRDHPESDKKRAEINYLLELTELRTEVSEKYKDIFGENSEYTLEAFTKLAISYRMLGWYYQRHENQGILCQFLLKTEDVLLDLLKKRQARRGDEDEGTLAVMDWLSLTYKVGSEWDAVEELQRWCLKIRTRDLGLDHVCTRWSRDHLVEALRALKKGEDVYDVLRRHTSIDAHWRRGSIVGQGSCSIRADI